MLTTNQTFVQTWNVGKELYPLLSKEDTIDGVAIIPAVALAMFVSVEARKARGAATSVDMRIRKPVLLEEPEQDILRLEIKKDAFSCTHLHAGEDKGIICSGTLRVLPTSLLRVDPAPEGRSCNLSLTTKRRKRNSKPILSDLGRVFCFIQRIGLAANYVEGWIVVSCSSDEKISLL